MSKENEEAAEEGEAVNAAATFRTGILLLSLIALPLYGQTVGGSSELEDLLISLTGSSNQVGSEVQVYGSNDLIKATAFECVWTLGDNCPHPFSALAMTIQSDDAGDSSALTGARTVLVECLDIDGVPFAETITMTGLTPAPMAAPCFRVQRLEVVSSGSAATNLGNITAENAATVFQQIGVTPDSDRVAAGLGEGHGTSHTASYTIPSALKAGDSPHLVVVLTEVVYSFKEGVAAEVRAIGPNGVLKTFPVVLGALEQLFVNRCYPAGGIFQIWAKSDSGNTSANIDLRFLIIDNGNSANPGQCISPGGFG